MTAHAQRMNSLLALDKEFAPCQVERRAYGAGEAGDGDASSVQGRGLDCRLGAGHGEERT